MSDLNRSARCIAATTWFDGRRCTHPAKYGDYCGIHSPEKIEERRAQKARRNQDRAAIARATEESA